MEGGESCHRDWGRGRPEGSRFILFIRSSLYMDSTQTLLRSVSQDYV